MTAMLERERARRLLSERLDEILPLELSAETPMLTVRPGPIGKPDGPGLWRVKGMGFPPYFQNVRNALIRNGHSTKDASKITWGAIRRWSRGGGKVHPEVRAAARAALASIAGKEARAHAQSAHEHVISVSDQLILREFANPYHGAAGSGKGGQFVAGQTSGSAPAAKTAGTAKAKPAPNQPKPISTAQKNAYLKQAGAYSAKAQALRQQAAQINHMIAALASLIAQEQKALAISSSGKTAAGAGTSTGSGSGTKTAAAKGTKTAASAKASATASATAKATAKAGSSSSLRTMLDSNKAQMKQLVAKRDALVNSANKMDQQAARFTRLANG